MSTLGDGARGQNGGGAGPLWEGRAVAHASCMVARKAPIDWRGVGDGTDIACRRAQSSGGRSEPMGAPPAIADPLQCGDGLPTPQPLPAALPPVPTFDSRLLPRSVEAWCQHLAEGLQVPPDFVAIPIMVALAGTIGRALGIALKRHEQWYETSVLWGGVVGRPSSGKTPAQAPARDMLVRLEKAGRADYDAAAREYQIRAMVTDGAKQAAKQKIASAMKKGDRFAAEGYAADVLFDDSTPTEPRILTNDATVEKLGELLNQNPRGLVLYRDELGGWLSLIDREVHQSDRTFYLEAWSGKGAYTVDRIGRGTLHIDACAVSILGGIQPGKLERYVRSAIRGGFADDGLIQRFQLLAWPDLSASWRYVDRPIDRQSTESVWGVFQRLRAIDPMTIGAERVDWCDMPLLRFDDEAQGLWIEWMMDLMPRLRRGDEPEWLESHYAKYPALVGRLALVLHAADGCAGAVSAATLTKALQWTDYLGAHARRVYSPAGEGGLAAAHRILKHRQELPDGFSARDLQRHHWAGLTEADVVGDGLDVLGGYHHLLEHIEVTGGRPAVTYTWRST